MRKKIEFKDAKDKAVALSNGRVFYDKAGRYKFYYDTEYDCPFRMNEINIDRSWSWDWYEEIEAVWPKDFRPCWCWVRDYEEGEERKERRFIYSYNPERDDPFMQYNGLVAWKIAIPMTTEEILKFSWEEIIK